MFLFVLSVWFCLKPQQDICSFSHTVTEGLAVVALTTCLWMFQPPPPLHPGAGLTALGCSHSRRGHHLPLAPHVANLGLLGEGADFADCIIDAFSYACFLGRGGLGEYPSPVPILSKDAP